MSSLEEGLSGGGSFYVAKRKTRLRGHGPEGMGLKESYSFLVGILGGSNARVLFGLERIGTEKRGKSHPFGNIEVLGDLRTYDYWRG